MSRDLINFGFGGLFYSLSLKNKTFPFTLSRKIFFYFAFEALNFNFNSCIIQSADKPNQEIICHNEPCAQLSSLSKIDIFCSFNEQHKTMS